MSLQFFDIHAHVNDKSFDEDRDVVLARMRERGVFANMVGTDEKSSREVVNLASRVSEGVYATIGIHPIDDKRAEWNQVIFEELVKSKSVIAIGECGLDYSRITTTTEKNRQQILFEKQIDFACAHNLPLMIHCRDSDKKLADAHREVLAILTEKKKLLGKVLRGNIHFFSQTIEIAHEYFDLDFTISFTGVITFSHEYDDVVRRAPLEHIMAETDCPYVTPTPYRGKRNEPIFVEEVVKKIATIRGEDFETVRVALIQNSMRVFSVTNNNF